MTTATAGLTVSAIAELLVASGYRVTVTIDEAVVAERPVLGTHVLRRVVAQANLDGSYRVGYLLARPGHGHGRLYEHDLRARMEGCRDLAQLIEWLAIQDARALPAKATAP